MRRKIARSTKGLFLCRPKYYKIPCFSLSGPEQLMAYSLKEGNGRQISLSLHTHSHGPRVGYVSFLHLKKKWCGYISRLKTFLKGPFRSESSSRNKVAVRLTSRDGHETEMCIKMAKEGKKSLENKSTRRSWKRHNILLSLSRILSRTV